jgi:hypothetical protein
MYVEQQVVLNGNIKIVKMDKNKGTMNYHHVVPDSGFWTSIDQMINYFTQVRNLDRREILVHLENMKKRGIIVLQGHLEEVKTKAYGENKEGYLTTDTVYETKWKWDGTNSDYPSKGIVGQVRDEVLSGGIKYYEPMTKEDFDNSLGADYPSMDYVDYVEEEEGRILKKKQRWEAGENDDNRDDGLVKDENGQPKGYTAREIRASGVFGIVYGDLGGLDSYPVVDSKTYLTKEALEKSFEASVERDLNRCK